MGSAVQKKDWNKFRGNAGLIETAKTKEKPKEKKKDRTPEETAALKRALFMNMNSYHVGSYKDAALDKLHNHIFQGDGDYVVVNNKIGNFFVKMAPNPNPRPGIESDIEGNKIQLKVPKIPGKIYYQIIAFFRDIADKMGNAEAFIQLYYDTQEKCYVPLVPEQTVSGGSVRYDATKNLNEVERGRYIFVFEVHSHNTMSAFWSSTDNADEKETKFYGVFGKIKDTNIEEKFRFMVMDKQIDVKKEHIFDFAETGITKEEVLSYLEGREGEILSPEELMKAMVPDKDEYPSEWKENVKQSVVYANNYIGGTKKTYGPNNSTYPNGYGEDGYGDGWGTEREEPDYWNHGNEKNQTGSTGATKEPGLCDEEIDILETFNIEEYTEEDHPFIIETFATSLDQMHASLLLDCLVEQGFDHLIQDLKRN